MTWSRRLFLAGSSALGTATAMGFGGLGRYVGKAEAMPEPLAGYGAPLPDPAGIFDLPAGFSYRAISRTGGTMTDGLTVPAAPDGMATFPGADGRVIIVRNHELGAVPDRLNQYGPGYVKLSDQDTAKFYDPGTDGKAPCGGTTTLVWNPATGEMEKEFMSLGGTLRNCAGGPTPWGTWLTCEETEAKAGEYGLTQDHGYVFEVKSDSNSGLQTAEPLKAMGRFYHEATATDPRTGIVYMTEDRNDGLFYRFVPNQPGNLSEGGRLEALAIENEMTRDTRNWGESAFIPVGHSLRARWIPIEDVEAKGGHVRTEGTAKGAAIFARGEGMWYAPGSILFAATSGGQAKIGQIWRYVPSPFEGTAMEEQSPGVVGLYIEPNDEARMEKCDNITVAPWGDLFVCEDGDKDQFIRGITPNGDLYTFARNGLGDGTGAEMSELCGACFSPDGQYLFVNIQRPGLTLAITGPWTRSA